jgi:hypothetical protein
MDGREKTVTVYGLRSFYGKKIRYVGQTNKPLFDRLKEHLCSVNRGQSHNVEWIKQVTNAGDHVCIFSIEENAVRNDAEIRWIAWYRKNGAKLTNISPGGDGASFPKSLSHRLAIGLAHKGKAKSKEHKEKISASLRGRPLPGKLLEIVRLGLNRKPWIKMPTFLGGKHSEDTKRQISERQIGKKFSEETRRKMRESSARRWKAHRAASI